MTMIEQRVATYLAQPLTEMDFSLLSYRQSSYESKKIRQGILEKARAEARAKPRPTLALPTLEAHLALRRHEFVHKYASYLDLDLPAWAHLDQIKDSAKQY